MFSYSHTRMQAGHRRSFTPVSSGLLQRCTATEECDECRTRRLARQRNPAIHAGPASVPGIVNEVLRSPGQPLDLATRSFMEPRFGHDFSQVRIHTDAQAAESAQAVGATAYTVGRHIVFGEAFQPQRQSGLALLAHELTHVVQQGLQDAPGGALAVGPAESAPERQAQEMAASHALGRARSIGPAITGAQVQRQAADQGPGAGAAPASTGSCYTCDIPGGVGVCCYAPNTPIVPECFELGKRIIDNCQGSTDDCLRRAQCATCQCTGQTLGSQYCQCTGIV